MATYKVFQIGFNKCGTRTLEHFFEANGHPSIHWAQGKLALQMLKNHRNNKPLLTGYEQYTFYSDMEATTSCDLLLYAHVRFYKKLDRQYPNSKFILNTRNVDKWIVSRCKHGDGKYLKYVMGKSNKSKEEVIKMWKHQWNKHHQDVIRYFKGREHQLLVFDIEKDPLDKLIKFFSDLNLKKEHYTILGVTPK